MNLFVISGRLTSDILEGENVGLTKSGNRYCYFTLAVTRNYKDSEGNYPVDFIRCMAYGNTVDFMVKYCTKGEKINVGGRIESYNTEDEEGNRYTQYSFIVTEVDKNVWTKEETEELKPQTKDNYVSAKELAEKRKYYQRKKV